MDADTVNPKIEKLQVKAARKQHLARFSVLFSVAKLRQKMKL
jgi:hypothetical protein